MMRKHIKKLMLCLYVSLLIFTAAIMPEVQAGEESDRNPLTPCADWSLFDILLPEHLDGTWYINKQKISLAGEETKAHEPEKEKKTLVLSCRGSLRYANDAATVFFIRPSGEDASEITFWFLKELKMSRDTLVLKKACLVRGAYPCLVVDVPKDASRLKAIFYDVDGTETRMLCEKGDGPEEREKKRLRDMMKNKRLAKYHRDGAKRQYEAYYGKKAQKRRKEARDHDLKQRERYFANLREREERARIARWEKPVKKVWSDSMRVVPNTTCTAYTYASKPNLYFVKLPDADGSINPYGGFGTTLTPELETKLREEFAKKQDIRKRAGLPPIPVCITGPMLTQPAPAATGMAAPKPEEPEIRVTPRVDVASLTPLEIKEILLNKMPHKYRDPRRAMEVESLELEDVAFHFPEMRGWNRGTAIPQQLRGNWDLYDQKLASPMTPIPGWSGTLPPHAMDKVLLSRRLRFSMGRTGLLLNETELWEVLAYYRYFEVKGDEKNLRPIVVLCLRMAEPKTQEQAQPCFLIVNATSGEEAIYVDREGRRFSLKYIVQPNTNGMHGMSGYANPDEPQVLVPPREEKEEQSSPSPKHSKEKNSSNRWRRNGTGRFQGSW